MRNHANGNQVKARAREMRRAERLADRLDRAVALQDQALGQESRGFPRAAAPELIGAAPVRPAAPAPELANRQASRSELEGTYGVSGTPITSGFLSDLGEYNAELMGRSAIQVYEQMRRGDAQVRATLAACKLPVQSAKWEVVPNRGRRGRASESKAKEVAEFVAENLFEGLEFRIPRAGGPRRAGTTWCATRF